MFLLVAFTSSTFCILEHSAKYKYLLFFKCNTNKNTFVPSDCFCKEITSVHSDFGVLFVEYLLNSELIIQQSFISIYENYMQVFIFCAFHIVYLLGEKLLIFHGFYGEYWIYIVVD